MLMSSAGAKLGLTGITPPTQQKPAGKNPAYEEGVKKIAKERVDTVKYLRETEARIRTVRDVLKEVGTESDFGKQQKTQLDQLLNDQQTYNKKIKFLDSRLKDPKLVSTYVETKQPIPQELKPSVSQEVLLGEKEWQKALVKGQNKYNKMANDALDAVGFKYVPEGIVKDITKGVLNPLSYTQTVADVFGNPTKFMDDTFYTMANPNASAEERALGGLNFVLFVASVVPGAAALKRGGVKQLLDEAVEKAVAAGVKVESAVNKVKKALDPATYKNILAKAKELGQTFVTAGTKKLLDTKETAKDIVTGKSKIKVKQPSGVFSGIPLPSISIQKNLDNTLNQTAEDIAQKMFEKTNKTAMSTSDIISATSEFFKGTRQLSRVLIEENKLTSLNDLLKTTRIKLEKIKEDYKKTDAFLRNPTQQNVTNYLSNSSVYQTGKKERERIKTEINSTLRAIQDEQAKITKLNDLEKDVKEIIMSQAEPFLSKRTSQRQRQGGFIDLSGLFKFTNDEKKALDNLIGQNADNVIIPAIKTPGLKIIDGIDWVKTKVVNRVATISSFGTKEDVVNSLLDDVYKMIKPGGKKVGVDPLDPTNFTTLLNKARKENLDITDAQLKQIVSDFKSKVDADEIIPKGGTFLFFPKALQDKIANELKNMPTGKTEGWARKLFGSGLAPEKRFVERNLPSALPTINLRSENLRDFYTALGDKVKILEPVFNKFKSGANQQELQPIIDIIRNPFRSAGGAMGEIQIGSLLGNLDTIIQKQGTSSDAKVIAQAMYDSISDLLGKGIIKRNETLSDFIVRTSSATGDKVFSMANYKKIAEKEGRQALIDQLDPLAITYHLTNVAQQQAKVKEAVLTRNVLNDFIQKTIDEFGDTEQGKKLAGRQLINLFENVNTQLKQSLPGLDAESNKVLPPFMNTFLSKSSQLAGKSMIAGNVSTMLSQLSPIVWNLAEQGIMPTLSGIGRQLFKGGVPLDKSTFLTNRFKQDTGKSLYNVVKSRYIQNDKGAIGKAYNIAKSIWSEGVVDAVTRNTVEAMDKLMSNITFTTAYQKAKNSGATEEQAIRIADSITEKIISGRAPGDLPPVFSNDLFKSVLQYQLEVMNQANLARDLWKGADGKAKLFKGIKGTVTYLAGAYLINNQIERVNNRRPVFDPIGLVEDAYKGKGLKTETMIGKGKQVNVPLPPALGRVPSKSYFKDFTSVAQEIAKNITGISNIDLSSLPSVRTIRDVPEFIKIANDPERANKNAALAEVGGRLLASFVKGGSQTRKTLLGIYAIANGYVDESKINPKKLSTLNQELDDLEQQEDILAAKNRFERNEKKIYISPDTTSRFLAILFGPKGTSEARISVAKQESQARRIRALKNELAKETDKAARKEILQEIAQEQQDYREKFGGLP